jgi:DNA-binding CsgD family transcriptional regulator
MEVPMTARALKREDNPIVRASRAAEDAPRSGPFNLAFAALDTQARKLGFLKLMCRYRSGDGALAVVREFHSLDEELASLIADRTFRQTWPIETAAADQVLPSAWTVMRWPGSRNEAAVAAMERLKNAGVEGGVSLAVRGPGARMSIVTAFCRTRVLTSLKDADLDRLLVVASRFHASVVSLGRDPLSNDRLSRREFEILRVIAEGLTAAATARRLTLSEATVKFHLASVRRKLGVKNTPEAIARLYLSGLPLP